MLERVSNREQVIDLHKEFPLEDNWYWWVEGANPTYDKFEEWIRRCEYDSIGFFINKINIKGESLAIGFSRFGNTDIMHGFSYLTVWIKPSLRRSRSLVPYGMLATFEAMSFAFNNFPLRKIYQNIVSENSDSIKPMSKIATLEGRLKEHYYINGNYRDIITYSIDRSKFFLIDNRYRTTVDKFIKPGY